MAATATAVTEYLFEAKPLWSGQIGSGGVADGTTQTIPLQSATNLDSGDAYVFKINRVDSNGTKVSNPTANTEVCIGKLSGTNFINCVRGQEGTAQQWDAGTVVEVIFTATHWNKMIDFLGVEHNADGTHKKVTGMDNNTFVTANNNAGSAEVNMWKVNTSDQLQAGAAFNADGTYILDEDDMSSDSATALATQQSIKAYVDANAGAGGKYQFIIPGTAVAGTDVAGTWFAPDAITITAIDVHADTAGATGSTVIDVNKNGTSIYPTATKPTLADTATSDTGNVPDTTAGVANDKYTIDIDSVTTTAPTDLYVVIKYS